MEFREEGFILKRVNEGHSAVFESKSDVRNKVCDVCGYANENEAALCKMCSNYLYQGGVENEGKYK